MNVVRDRGCRGSGQKRQVLGVPLDRDDAGESGRRVGSNWKTSPDRLILPAETRSWLNARKLANL